MNPLWLIPVAWGLWGCSSDNKNPPKAPKNKPQSLEKCPGEEYEVVYDTDLSYTLCHNDKNGDGRYQAGQEDLWIRKGIQEKNRFFPYSSIPAWPLRNKLFLPNLDGMLLRNFKQSSELVFQGPKLIWEPKYAEQYKRVVQFCRTHGVDLGEVVDLTAKLHLPRHENFSDFSAHERIKALLLGASLLGFKQIQQREQSLAPYQNFVDIVQDNLRRGNLSLTSLAVQNGFSTQEANLLQYLHRQDTLLIRQVYVDPFLEFDASQMIFPLYQYYLDIQGKPVPLLEADSQAYGAQASYLLHLTKLASPEKTNQDLQSYLDLYFPESSPLSEWEKKSPDYLAAWIQKDHLRGEIPSPERIQAFHQSIIFMKVVSLTGFTLLAYQQSNLTPPVFLDFKNKMGITRQESKKEYLEKLNIYRQQIEQKLKDLFNEVREFISKQIPKETLLSEPKQKELKSFINEAIHLNADLFLLTKEQHILESNGKFDEASITNQLMKISEQSAHGLWKSKIFEYASLPFNGVIEFKDSSF